MTELVRARVEERLTKLRLGAVAQRLDGILSQAARSEPTYLDRLDQRRAEETEAKPKKRVAMGIQVARFPAIKTRAPAHPAAARAHRATNRPPPA